MIGSEGLFLRRKDEGNAHPARRLRPRRWAVWGADLLAIKFLETQPIIEKWFIEWDRYMAYTSVDSKAMEEAWAAGIRTKAVDIVDTSNCLTTLVCPRHPKAEDPASLLAKAIEASDRFMAESTICLEVEGSGSVPNYVAESIDLLNGYSVRIIIVCDGATTHLPGPLLGDELREAVCKASPGGMLWHPIAKELVYSNIY